MIVKLNSLITPFDDVGSRNLKLLTVAQAVLFVAAWAIAGGGTSVIPTPVEIGQAWNKLATEQGLLVELFRSARTIWTSIMLSAFIALGFSYLSTSAIFKPTAYWTSALRFLGFTGITFIFTLWTSSGFELKVWLLTFCMTTFLLTNMLAVVNSITQEQIDYARTLRIGGWGLTYELAFRGKLDEALDLIRQNASIGWVVLTSVEALVRSDGGVGAMLLVQNRHLHLAEIFATLATVLTYGLVQDYVLKLIRGLVCPYVRLINVKGG